MWRSRLCPFPHRLAQFMKNLPSTNSGHWPSPQNFWDCFRENAAEKMFYDFIRLWPHLQVGTKWRSWRMWGFSTASASTSKLLIYQLIFTYGRELCVVTRYQCFLLMWACMKSDQVIGSMLLRSRCSYCAPTSCRILHNFCFSSFMHLLYFIYLSCHFYCRFFFFFNLSFARLHR